MSRNICVHAAALFVALLIVPPNASRAQSSGPTIDVCSSGEVDYYNDIQQTVCLYGDKTGLDTYVYTEDDTWPDYGGGDYFVLDVASDAQLYDGSTFVNDAGWNYGGTTATSSGYGASPTINDWYNLYGFYQECYDSSGDGYSCSWLGSEGGWSVSGQITPSLSISSSSPNAEIGTSVTLTATVNGGVTGTATFYDGTTAIGTSSISGGSANFTTSSLTMGSHSIHATLSSLTSPTVTELIFEPGPIQIPSSGDIMTVAGNGVASYSGDGGNALLAELYGAESVAVDSYGDLYIADSGNNRIRKVTASTGYITTIAGTGTAGFSGDGGPATSANLHGPTGIALDSSDNIYFTDFGNQRVRKIVASTGNIATIAGNGTQGYSGDGGAATSAELDNPYGVAIDSSGNVYVADSSNNRIRKISSGTISTVAGNGTWGYSGDGGSATSAELRWPEGITFDASGNLYIADTDNARIRKVSSGIITTVAGGGVSGAGDGGSALSAELWWPAGIAVDASGNMFIADENVDTIRKVTASSGIITTLAGTWNTPGYTGDGGPASSAKIYYPYFLALDSAGNLYFADWGDERVRVIGSAGSSKPSVSLAVSTSGSPSTYGTPVIFTATAGTSGTAPTGAINFYDNGTFIGSGSITAQPGTGGAAVLGAGLLSEGTHSINAYWPGDSNYSAATSANLTQTVTDSPTSPGGGAPGWTTGSTPTTVSLSNPSSTPAYGAADVLTISVAATGTGYPTGIVTVYDSTAIVGGAVLHNGQGNVSLSSLAPGAHTIFAQYFGDQQYAPTSGALTPAVTVQTGPPQMALTSGSQFSISGDAVNANVQLTTSPGLVPQGSVTCTDGSVSAGPQTIDSHGHALVSVTGLANGASTLSCTFTSSVNSDVSTSNLSVVVASSAGFSTTSTSMNTARTLHTATVLSNGDVLLAGGAHNVGSYVDVPLNTTEIYDPVNGYAGTAPTMNSARYLHTATALSDGTVLVAGGITTSGGTFYSAEYYDPTGNAFHAVGNMQTPRYFHTATLLNNGLVLITGGQDDSTNSVLSSAELYDPATSTFSYTGSMNHARTQHTATLLPNGKVLIIGGAVSSTGLNTMELYDPNAGTFTSINDLNTGRGGHTATLLADGTVLVAGGWTGTSFTALSSAEIVDPNADTSTNVGSMSVARYAHTATLLDDGTVLVAGGNASGGTSATATSEIYNPTTQTWTTGYTMSTSRAFHTATLLPGTDQVIFAGGQNESPVGTSELYAYTASDGGLDPKFEGLAVLYSPPGSQSSVQYTDTTTASSTTQDDTTFSGGVSEMVSLTAKVPLIGTAGTSATGGYTYSTDTNNSLTVQHGTAANIAAHGPPTSGIGVDHDFDVVYVWFNPVSLYSVPATVSNAITWRGYKFDANDNNNQGNPDVAPIPMFCLKNPYNGYCYAVYSAFWLRGWDASGNGPLTLADFASLLTLDPFMANPNYDPYSDPQQRFNEQSQLIDFIPGGGSSYGGQLSVSTTNSSSNSSTNKVSASYTANAKVSSPPFLASIASMIKTTLTFSWTYKATQTNQTVAGTQSQFTITDPLLTDNYSGPEEFSAYVDSWFQTFMFFASSRPTIPTATIGVSPSTLSFGTTTVGSLSTQQAITITNTSSVSLSMDPSIFTGLNGIGISSSSQDFTISPGTCVGPGVTLAPNASCTAYVQFAPQSADANPTGTTAMSATVIVAGVELASGSTRVLITAQLPVSGTASR
jgi:hypothetical protein